MSVAASRTKVVTALRDMRARWQDVATRWDDPVSRRFEEEHILPLDGAVRAAMSAMEEMDALLARARKECG